MLEVSSRVYREESQPFSVGGFRGSMGVQRAYVSPGNITLSFTAFFTDQCRFIFFFFIAVRRKTKLELNI